MNALALSLIVALFSPPEAETPPAPAPVAHHVPQPQPQPMLATRPNLERRAKRFFITSGVLMGVGFIGELIGAGIATNCLHGRKCTLGTVFEFGSPDAGVRYTLISTGTGSAYGLARLVSTPLMWTAKGFMYAGGHAQGIADAAAGVPIRVPRWVGWALFGSGLGVYLSSRLARLGFALGGACQDPMCLYAFDIGTLGVSRGLSFPGTALLIHRRIQTRVRFGIVPMGARGLALTGQF
jgi:hypothetical protein